jgi:hypothetical protein
MIQFTLPTGANKTYVLLQSARFGFTIDKAYYDTESGTITANVKINTTSVTSLSALSLSSTPGNATASGANTVAADDTVNLTLSSNAAGVMVSLMLECSRT